MGGRIAEDEKNGAIKYIQAVEYHPSRYIFMLSFQFS